jgi:sec-independent protein translocase protein TatA
MLDPSAAYSSGTPRRESAVPIGELSPWHLLIVAVVFIVLFGSKKLPDASRSLGRSLRIFKSEMSTMKDEFKAEASGTAQAAAPAQPAAPVQPPAIQPVQDTPVEPKVEAKAEAKPEA